MKKVPNRNDHEKTDAELEQELQAVFARQDAPAGLKQRILQARESNARKLLSIEHPRKGVQWHLMARLAATVLIAAGVGGALVAHHMDEERKAENARKQLYLALQITNHAMHHVHDRLALKSRSHE
jgi:hypothetical protein